MNEDTGTCGICGVEPVSYENTKMGLTEVNLCEECYEEFLRTSAMCGKCKKEIAG